MFKRLLVASALAFAGIAFTSTDAEAKKIPIPCTGDRFVPIDAPEVNKVLKEKGFQLTYRFSGCSGAAFALYDGNSRYVDLPAEAIATFKREVGRPLVAPGFWSSFFKSPGQFIGEWIWLVILLIGGLVMLVRKPVQAIVESNPGNRDIPTAREPMAERQTPVLRPSAPQPVQRAAAPEARGSFGTRAARPARSFGATRSG
jgi:hypothetical protein